MAQLKGFSPQTFIRGAHTSAMNMVLVYRLKRFAPAALTAIPSTTLKASGYRLCYTSGIALLLALALLAGCGGGAVPRPAVEEPRGEELPGRLLFVQNGVIWQWQGRGARPLIGDGAAIQPAFSPDGRQIAYVARSNSASDLLLAGADGAPLGRLTSNDSTTPLNSLERVYESRWVFYPAWSADGGELLAAAQARPPEGDPPAEYNLALYTFSLGGTGGQPLYAEAGADCGRVAVGPGGQIVFVRAEATQRLYILDPADAAPTPLEGAPEGSYDPAFSLDGRWVAFAVGEGGGSDIFALPVAGSVAAARLTSLGSARAPAFSPDGRLLAFLAIAPGEGGFDLWVADLTVGESGTLSAGQPRRLTSGMNLDADSSLSWAP